MSKTIQIKPLTAENFAKYGKIIDLNQPNGDVSDGMVDYWPLYGVTCKLPTVGILEIRRQGGVSPQALERHLLYEEVFIPVDGMGVMPFAPAADLENLDAEPDISRIEAFLIDGTKALVIEKGVWHYPARPITPAIRFAMVVSEECGNDLYEKPVEGVVVTL